VLFLHSREFRNTYGIFVERPRNTIILGEEFLKEGKFGNVNRHNKHTFMGKRVRVKGGQWKGYMGTVVEANEKTTKIELFSRLKKINVPTELIDLIEGNTTINRSGQRTNDYEAGSQSIYNRGKTPMHIPNGGESVWGGGMTPHPQSPGNPSDYAD
jgi:transcription elongation factor